MTAAFQMIQAGLNEIAQASTLRIVDCLVEGTLITIFAGLVLRAARLAEFRHAVRGVVCGVGGDRGCAFSGRHLGAWSGSRRQF